MIILPQRPLSKSILFVMLVLFCASLLAEEKKKTYQLEPNVHAELIGIHKQIDEGQNGKAIERLKRSLDEIIIDGIETTTELFNLLLNEPDIKNGDYNIHWLEEWLVKREE